MRGRSQFPREMPLLMDNLHVRAEISDGALQNARLLLFSGQHHGRMLKVEVGRQLDDWLKQADNIEKWESNGLMASDRRVLITQWVGAAAEDMNNGGSSDEDDEGKLDFLTMMMLLGFRTPLSADTARGQNDELSLLDEDDTMGPADEILGMEVPDGFSLQEATAAALDNSLLQRLVLVSLSIDWFAGLITRQSQQRTRQPDYYRVLFDLDESTRSTKLPLKRYSGDPDAVVGSWVLLEGNTVDEGADPTMAE
ncbi:unnamed protein product [Ectocarpus sp. CCAP 1310/34]|nr:unnamed protein product [Ectocarpus sp. CCAP 1310/34]